MLKPTIQPAYSGLLILLGILLVVRYSHAFVTTPKGEKFTRYWYVLIVLASALTIIVASRMLFLAVRH
jgi:hypothetical protein